MIFKIIFFALEFKFFIGRRRVWYRSVFVCVCVCLYVFMCISRVGFVYIGLSSWVVYIADFIRRFLSIERKVLYYFKYKLGKY